MGAVRMYLRATLRHRLGSTAAVALLVAVAGGAVMSATASARRTQSAYDRMVDATVPLLLGVPLGLVLGNWSWRRLVTTLGIANDQVVPVLALAALVVVTLLLANLIAAIPARTAARTRPAVVLRSE
jgi:hypothetical protein